MTEPAIDLVEPSTIRARSPWITRGDLLVAAVTIAALAAVGALAGLGWAAWSRTATRGLLTTSAVIPDDTEGFISSDGRFAVITALIGLLAAAVVWQRRSARGPVMVAALALGAVLGALLTDLVGGLVGGGRSTGAAGTIVTRLPLEVHAVGFLFVEAVLAVGCYVLCVAFVNPDDLGRSPVPLVGLGVELQQRGGHGDATGTAQQDDLAPQ